MASIFARIASSPIQALLVDRVGRRNLIIYSAGPYLAGWIVISMATTSWELYIAKFLSGIGEAALFTAVPIYMAEVSEPDVRGRWANLFVVFTHFGQFVINIIGSFLNIQMSALICLSVTLTYALLTSCLPESPYYLIMKEKDEQARTALQTLRWKRNVEEELANLQMVVRKQTQESGKFSDLFSEKNRNASLITIGNRSLQQFSGINMYVFYTQYIFQQAGGSISQSASSIIFTGSLMLGCLINGYILGMLGRRPAMMLSTSMCSIFLSVEAFYFFVKENDLLDISALGWVPLFGMMGYIVGMCVGLALVPTLMLGELFPANVKGNAMCLNNIVAGVVTLILTKVFQLLVSNYGLFVPFAYFAVCCALGVIYSYLFVPETRGKSLDEIQQYLKGAKI